jgi:methionyl-tRNA synthetase
MRLLDPSHHGVQLDADERRRVIVWLDANAEFFGAYEEIDAQARGEVVFPSLE